MNHGNYKLDNWRNSDMRTLTEISRKKLSAINQSLTDPLTVILILSKRLSESECLNEKGQKDIMMISKNAKKIANYLSDLAEISIID